MMQVADKVTVTCTSWQQQGEQLRAIRYKVFVEEGANEHTLKIEDSAGMDLGTIGVTVTAMNGLEAFDTSMLMGASAPTPAVDAVTEATTLAIDVDVLH